MRLTRTYLIVLTVPVIGEFLMAEPARQSDQDKCPCQLISLEIKFPKKQVSAGELVRWQIQFTNKSDRPITFYWKTNPFFEFVTITIRGPRRSQAFIVDSSLFAPISPKEWQAYTLKPGESQVDERAFIENEPGTYIISAEFYYLGIRTKAEPVAVVVLPR